MRLKIVAEDKYLPEYANNTDACMDLKAKIVDNKPCERNFPNYRTGVVNVLHETENSLWIFPGELVKLHTGVQVAIPEGYVMKIYPRSSTGIKKHLCLANGTGIIDAGYRDEIIMALYNFGSDPIEIKDGDRLCQFILLPYPKIELEQVSDDADFREGDRGGGIGSTGI